MCPGPPFLSILLLMLSLMPHPAVPQDSPPVCPSSRTKLSLAYLNPKCTAPRKMRISEGPGPPPSDCLRANNSQCLSSVSDTDPARACSQPGRFRLEQCREFSLPDVLGPDIADCERRVRLLKTIDVEVGILLCSFEEILRRYDCETPYSVVYGCAHCRVSPLHYLDTD